MGGESRQRLAAGLKKHAEQPGTSGMAVVAAGLFVNIVLIAVIILEGSLHAPMYICLCNLSVNELLGSCSLLPQLMANLLSETNTISYTACFVQIFCIQMYATVEIIILTVMAYDRYVAICNPLRYSTIMTNSKISKLLISTIEKLYCDNISILKLSCVDPSVNSIYGLVMLTIHTVVPLIIVIYSYFKILEVCLKISKEARAKAFHTCALFYAEVYMLEKGCTIGSDQS
nr:PREDICTED: olfactory receptor-like protein OLF3 [Latimeria chalumnae]|eukprot:XP_014351426.1 PREDICTED: olfactory receptor-like protein OLF3 [Latimeria chalumnae]